MSVKETHYVMFGWKVKNQVDDEDEEGNEIEALVALRPEYERGKNKGTYRFVQDHMGGGEHNCLGFVQQVADAYNGESIGFEELPDAEQMRQEHGEELQRLAGLIGHETDMLPDWIVFSHYA